MKKVTRKTIVSVLCPNRVIAGSFEEIFIAGIDGSTMEVGEEQIQSEEHMENPEILLVIEHLKRNKFRHFALNEHIVYDRKAESSQT